MLMLREMRNETGRRLLIFFHPFVARNQFTQKGLRLRRWWFIAAGLAAVGLLGLTQQS